MRIVINEYVEFEFYIHPTTWYINTKNWFTPYKIDNDLGLGVENKLFCFTWQTHKLIERKFDISHTLLEKADFVFDEYKPKRNFKKLQKEEVNETSLTLTV